MNSALQMATNKGRFVGRGYFPMRANASISRCRVIQRLLSKGSTVFLPSCELLAASQTEDQLEKYPLNIGVGATAGKSIVGILIANPHVSSFNIEVKFREIGTIII